MENRYLLYIDILGFSELIEKQADQILELYEVIASLNAHRHQAFKTIVFSDTMLVYNLDGGDANADRAYLVMYLCEFAQDLQYRLTERGIFFRAVLVRGEFHHYELNAVPCFFGRALIDAYRSEKQINAIGLFIDRSIEGDSDIFKTLPFNDRFSFVFITQQLQKIEYLYGGRLPLDVFEVEQTDLIWALTPELLYLKHLYLAMRFHPDEKIRAKYANTWIMFESQYPHTTRQLVTFQFEFERISPGACWDKVLARFPESYAFAVMTRKEY